MAPRHNEDGSYTYGYEGGDGSYKVETKSVNGEVRGKYGYYDDLGQLREIEYGANKMGFVPTGTGINPALATQPQSHQGGANTFSSQNQFQATEDEDGQYRPHLHEAPYQYQPEETNLAVQYQPAQQYQHLQRQQQLGFPVSTQERQQRRKGRRQQVPATHNFAGQPHGLNIFQGHPASNINLNSGTYSLNY